MLRLHANANGSQLRGQDSWLGFKKCNLQRSTSKSPVLIECLIKQQCYVYFKDPYPRSLDAQSTVASWLYTIY